jgi:hypothetical protein
MRGAASGNWRMGFLAGGFSGYSRINQNHDFNGFSGTWLYDYTSTNGNNSTAGTGGHVAILGNFKPTSGNAQYSGLYIRDTINQTGSSSGQSRGIYINPILTAVASPYVAIESSAGGIKITDQTTGSASNFAASFLPT